jgi:predicted nucleic acid-binding protein
MASAAMADPAPRVLYVAEPSPRFGVPKPAVVDTSMVAALLFAEPEQAEASRMLAGCRPMAPDLLPYEISNVAVNKLRRGAALDLLCNRLARFSALGIELVPPDTALMLELAARFKLTAYDAAYLALAGALQCPLCTFDKRLADAADQYLGGPADTTP